MLIIDKIEYELDFNSIINQVTIYVRNLMMEKQTNASSSMQEAKNNNSEKSACSKYFDEDAYLHDEMIGEFIEKNRNPEKSACAHQKQVPDLDESTERKMRSNFTEQRQRTEEGADKSCCCVNQEIIKLLFDKFNRPSSIPLSTEGRRNERGVPVGDWIFYDSRELSYLISYDDKGNVEKIIDFRGMTPSQVYPLQK